VSPIRLAVLVALLLSSFAPAVAAAEEPEWPAEAMRDALDAEDTELALERLGASPGDEAGLGCVEALLRERRLADSWRPGEPPEDAPPEGADERASLLEAGLRDLRADLGELSLAYARCAQASHGARPTAEERRALRARGAAIDAFAQDSGSDDASSVDGLDAPENLDLSFEAIRAFYDAAPGVPRAAPERASMPTWRITPIIVSALVMMTPVVAVAGLARGSRTSDRAIMVALGVGLSGVAGVVVGRSWLRGGSGLLWGGLMTAGVLATGALSLALDGSPGRRAFGAGMLAGGALDLVWWLGGLILHRRDQAAHREWLRSIRPLVSSNLTRTTLGLEGTF